MHLDAVETWLASLGITDSVMGKLLETFFLLGLLYAVRVAAVRALRQGNGHAETRRRWLVGIRNASILIFLFATATVWAAELRTFALSLVAVAAAVAIGTKELIQCLLGGFYRSSSRLFTVGDRIEVGSHRGDVIDITLMSTTILEVGPKTVTHQQTGRAIVIPNSDILSHPVIVETYTDDFVLHTFSVPVSLKNGWSTAPEALLRACDAECAEFLPDARRHFQQLGRKNALEVPSPEPRVTLQISKPDEVVMTARIPTPARRKGRVEQRIIQRFLKEWLEPRFAAAEAPPSPPPVPSSPPPVPPSPPPEPASS